ANAREEVATQPTQALPASSGGTLSNELQGTASLHPVRIRLLGYQRQVGGLRRTVTSRELFLRLIRQDSSAMQHAHFVSNQINIVGHMSAQQHCLDRHVRNETPKVCALLRVKPNRR